jgi:thiosulfate reductase cytochrome b subunit
VEHLKLRFPKGEAARRYNALQKIAYFTVIFILGPLVVLTGLTMSPTMDAAFPFLPWIFGGRQSARTIHFVCAFSFVAFFLVHIIMVVLSGTWNNFRSMITGRYNIERDGGVRA